MPSSDVDQVKQRHHSPRRLRWLDDLGRDTAYGLRILRNRPGFTLAVVLSLALGIGANTAIFSLMDAVLWRMLPVDRPEELWAVGDGYRYQEFRVLAENTTVLSGVAAYGNARLNVSIDGSLEPTACRTATRSRCSATVIGPAGSAAIRRRSAASFRSPERRSRSSASRRRSSSGSRWVRRRTSTSR